MSLLEVRRLLAEHFEPCLLRVEVPHVALDQRLLLGAALERRQVFAQALLIGSADLSPPSTSLTISGLNGPNRNTRAALRAQIPKKRTES